jgi:hypothetical protein
LFVEECQRLLGRIRRVWSAPRKLVHLL